MSHAASSGLRFVLDTNAVGNPDPATTADLAELHKLFQEGLIDLTRTDTMDTELASASDEKREDLLAASGQYVEHLGPMVIGHSRLDHAVLGNDDDARRIDKVYAILRPNGDRSAANPHDVRDAMHIATAIRYGAGFFVTSDKKVLAKRDDLRQAFDWFTVLGPAEALVVARRFADKEAELRRRLQTRPTGT